MNWAQPGQIICSPSYSNIDEYVTLNGGCPQELPSDFELIGQGESPRFPKWKKTPLYKFDANGTRRVWQVGFDGNNILRLSGTSQSTQIKPRIVELNTSGRTLTEQALLQSSKMYKDKIKKGSYCPLTDGTYQPVLKGMRGQHLKPNSTADWNKGMIADIKLDGLRMLCFFDGSNVRLQSNGNETYDHLTHIKNEIIEFSYYLPINSVIDGELYNKEMTLPEINSAVRTYVKFNPESLRICYYIFDLDWPATPRPVVEDRHEMLVRAYTAYTSDHPYSYLQLVPKWQVFSYQQAINDMKSAIEQGYEGLILRHPGRGVTDPKKRKRSEYIYGSKTIAIYKLKQTITDEAPVVGVTYEKGDTRLGNLQIRDQVSGAVLTIRGGDEESRMYWLQHPESVIGRILQYKYCVRDKRTRIPQQPTIVGWREVYC